MRDQLLSFLSKIIRKVSFLVKDIFKLLFTLVLFQFWFTHLIQIQVLILILLIILFINVHFVSVFATCLCFWEDNVCFVLIRRFYLLVLVTCFLLILFVILELVINAKNWMALLIIIFRHLAIIIVHLILFLSSWPIIRVISLYILILSILFLIFFRLLFNNSIYKCFEQLNNIINAVDVTLN